MYNPDDTRVKKTSERRACCLGTISKFDLTPNRYHYSSFWGTLLRVMSVREIDNRNYDDVNTVLNVKLIDIRRLQLTSSLR